MTAAEHKTDLELIKDTPYLALTVSYRVSIVRIWEKIDHPITGPHYTFYHFFLTSCWAAV